MTLKLLWRGSVIGTLLCLRLQEPYQVPNHSSRRALVEIVSEDKLARKQGLVGPYVKTTRTVLLFYNIVQYLYVYNYLFI